MKIMAIPIRNTVYEKIQQANTLTDVELYKNLVKNGHVIANDRFNKILLDLEILGLIKVSWITKDERRIQTTAVAEEEIDKVEEQNKQAMEKDYEASFPGVDK